MKRDILYEYVQKLIESKNITQFAQIFIVVSKSTFAIEINANNKRINKILENPGTLTLDEMNVICKMLNLDLNKIGELVANQVNNNSHQ